MAVVNNVKNRISFIVNIVKKGNDMRIKEIMRQRYPKYYIILGTLIKKIVSPIWWYNRMKNIVEKVWALSKGLFVRMEARGYVFKPSGDMPFLYLPAYREDAIQRSLFLHEKYNCEPELDYVMTEFQQGRIGKEVSQDCVVLDIGANVGNHTLYFYNRCKARNIYAFEPIVKTYNVLNTNVVINKLENYIKTIHAAVGAHSSKASVKLFIDNNWGGVS